MKLKTLPPDHQVENMVLAALDRQGRARLISISDDVAEQNSFALHAASYDELTKAALARLLAKRLVFDAGLECGTRYYRLPTLLEKIAAL